VLRTARKNVAQSAVRTKLEPPEFMKILPGLLKYLVFCIALPVAAAPHTAEPEPITCMPTLVKQAEAGDVDAQFRLGSYYDSLDRTTEHQELAFKWMLMAAEQGHAAAQADVAHHYRMGTGVKSDLKEAVKWYTRAAEQGDPAGSFGLGRMYYRGHGVEQNYNRARELYEEAAKSGHASAQAALGYMLDNGLGTQSDDVEALKWYILASENWHTANNYVYFMSKKMDEEAINKAHELAKQYKQEHYQ
jgi:TPR repeat protein